MTDKKPEGNKSIDHRADLPHPKLRLHVNDIRHPAFKAFLSSIPNLESVLESALTAIIQNLYTAPDRSPSPSPSSSPQTNRPRPTFTPSIPPTRSVTLLLRDIDGVAYTTSTELDTDHKEIHLSLPYIHTTTRHNADPAAELRGVLTHELVHCYQHTAPRASSIPTTTSSASDSSTKPHPRPPGGLIEGIADFVRLKADLAPPHWKRPTCAHDRPEHWDSGYQHTAYFLAWLEDVRVGVGAVGMLNDRLLRVGYYVRSGEEDSGVDFWEALFGERVEELWCAYGVYLDGLGLGGDGDGEGDGGGNGNGNGTWEEEIVNPES